MSVQRRRRVVSNQSKPAMIRVGPPNWGRGVRQAVESSSEIVALTVAATQSLVGTRSRTWEGEVSQVTALCARCRRSSRSSARLRVFE